MKTYFEAHWTEWLNELQIPSASSKSSTAEATLVAELKAQQIAALQACLNFHLKSFPAGSTPEFICDELNQGRFYSLAAARRDAPRTARHAGGSILKDVLLAQGCWLNVDPELPISKMYREQFHLAYYFDWSHWVEQKPHGLEYLTRRGNQFFKRFCGLEPVRVRKCPYVRDYHGHWDLKTHLALLTQGDYTDFLSKSGAKLPAPLVQDVPIVESSADFENDECCQRAAKRLFTAISAEPFTTLTDDELSLLYLFLLGEDQPHETLASLTAQPADRFLPGYTKLRELILDKLGNDITRHKFNCPCLKQFLGNHQHRSRCRCLAYLQHADWYSVTHEKLFPKLHQHLLKNFTRHCESVLNRQRLYTVRGQK